MESGVCYIQPEFLIADERVESPREEPIAENGNKRKASTDASEAAQEAAGADTKKRKNERKRGQNKNRPIYKEDRTLHLCNSLMEGAGNKDLCSLPNCRYVHDVQAYLDSKGPDLGKECPVYVAKGYCPRGVTCRFAKSHLDENGNNIKASNFDANAPPTTVNGIATDLQIRLRKRDYDFSRTKNLISKFEKLLDVKKQDASTPIDENVEKPVGCIVENGTSKDRDAVRKRPVDFAKKLVLSPLTTVGNLPFRRICKEFGADITCGEMACAVPLVKALNQEWALTKRHKSEDVFGVQLCGNNPTIITQVAQILQETATVDYIDLNIGCPIDLIYRQGGGSALMRRTNILELTVRSCAALSPDVPFTVKMRTGVYADKSVAHELLPMVEEWGASAVTLHGRSREQRYSKSANWAYIEQCAQKAKTMPVIGNGDILSFEDYNEKMQLAPHVSSAMIGRGALIKPWIFKEIKEQKVWKPTSSERFDMMRKYCNYGLEHWGSDTKGVENTRRFLLEWQSFLYRYIPYDLLVSPPQKINERPQKYRGRDEMETLLCSSSSSDWVKLSEMLLGKVPEGFTFMPKHKANSY